MLIFVHVGTKNKFEEILNDNNNSISSGFCKIIFDFLLIKIFKNLETIIFKNNALFDVEEKINPNPPSA